jgi:hypothetical protein
MSIATREAAESYPFKDSFTEHGNERTNLRREGYIAGRTAPVTEEEIEAAAKAMYEATFWQDEPVFGWEQTQSIYRKKARLALSAARKQVSDE